MSGIVGIETLGVGMLKVGSVGIFNFLTSKKLGISGSEGISGMSGIVGIETLGVGMLKVGSVGKVHLEAICKLLSFKALKL